MKKIEFMFIFIILILVVINISTSNKFLEERKFSFKEAIKVANAQPEGYPTGLYIHYHTMKYTYCWYLTGYHDSYWKTCCSTWQSVACDLWSQKPCDICGPPLLTCDQHGW